MHRPDTFIGIARPTFSSAIAVLLSSMVLVSAIVVLSVGTSTAMLGGCLGCTVRLWFGTSTIGRDDRLLAHLAETGAAVRCAVVGNLVVAWWHDSMEWNGKE